MIFRNVLENELDSVFHLYRSVFGTTYCVWDEEYPGWAEIQEDFTHGTLYIMKEDTHLLGAISIIVHNELDELNCWNEANAREFARVVVAPDAQGKGIAEKMVTEICGLLRKEGIPAIHLLVAKANLPAQSVYRKTGFAFLKSCFMFGHDYIACEKIL